MQPEPPSPTNRVNQWGRADRPAARRRAPVPGARVAGVAPRREGPGTGAPRAHRQPAGLNISPHLEGHPCLKAGIFLGPFGVAFYSVRGLWPYFLQRELGGWLFFGTSVRGSEGGLLFGPGLTKGPGHLNGGVFRRKGGRATFASESVCLVESPSPNPPIKGSWNEG